MQHPVVVFYGSGLTASTLRAGLVTVFIRFGIICEPVIRAYYTSSLNQYGVKASPPAPLPAERGAISRAWNGLLTAMLI